MVPMLDNVDHSLGNDPVKSGLLVICKDVRVCMPPHEAGNVPVKLQELTVIDRMAGMELHSEGRVVANGFDAKSTVVSDGNTLHVIGIDPVNAFEES